MSREEALWYKVKLEPDEVLIPLPWETSTSSRTKVFLLRVTLYQLNVRLKRYFSCPGWLWKRPGGGGGKLLPAVWLWVPSGWSTFCRSWVILNAPFTCRWQNSEGPQLVSNSSLCNKQDLLATTRQVEIKCLILYTETIVVFEDISPGSSAAGNSDSLCFCFFLMMINVEITLWSLSNWCVLEFDGWMNISNHFREILLNVILY